MDKKFQSSQDRIKLVNSLNKMEHKILLHWEDPKKHTHFVTEPVKAVIKWVRRLIHNF
jgi:hypothetical protein